MKILIIYLAVINVITFLAYGIDKSKAKHKRWRTPEAVLLGLAAIGGSVGAWAGMLCFRHKTQHWKFKVGVPLILAIQIAAALYFWK